MLEGLAVRVLPTLVGRMILLVEEEEAVEPTLMAYSVLLL